MKKENILEYPYKVKDMVLGKADMSLIDLVNQRQIRNTQVNSILRDLKQGKHFDSMFVVNVNNGTRRIRVIDGGHRTQALKKYFETYPNEKVKVSMAVYNDLTDSEERAIFTKWNLGVKQSVDDFINSYKVEIPEYESMLEELPVNIYGSKNKMKLRYIVDAYLSARTNPYTGGCAYTRLEWLSALKEIDYDAVASMKDSFGVIKNVFNQKDIVDFTRLTAFKFSNFKAIFRLVDVNKVLLGKNYVVKRMSKILYNNSIMENYRIAHRQGTVESFEMYRRMLNQGVDHKFK